MARPAYCVIFNPAAGRGVARRSLASLRRTLGSQAEFQPTRAPGHAEELAHAAALAGFEVVTAVGGDGTVHEVANGVLRANAPQVAFAVVPAGSANDYAYSLRLEKAWWLPRAEPPQTRLVDVGLIRAPGRERFFVNCLGLGFNGMVTLESRRIRRLRGVALYGCALLRALWYHYSAPPMTLVVDDVQWHLPTLAFSLALGEREGNFVLAPNAQLDDGLFDFMHAGLLARREMLKFVPGMISGNLPVGHPALRFGRCRHAEVTAATPLMVHIDGEFFCTPTEDVCQCQVDLLPLRLRVHGRWRT